MRLLISIVAVLLAATPAFAQDERLGAEHFELLDDDPPLGGETRPDPDAPARPLTPDAPAPPHAPAERPEIPGAFGFTLGEVFNRPPGRAGTRIEEGDAFIVSPMTPFRSFETYAVYVTPRTGLIFSIVGWREMDSKSSCKAEKRFVARVLDRKYGPRIKLPASSRPKKTRWYQGQNERVIALSCKNRRLRILYVDLALREQGAEEIQALQDEVDDSGL